MCCLLEIFQYFCNEDLQMLNAACKITSQCATEDELETWCGGEYSGGSSDEEDSSDNSYRWLDDLDSSDG